VHIRAADADRVQLDLDHARPDLVRQVDVAESQFVLTFKDEGALQGHSYFLSIKLGVIPAKAGIQHPPNRRLHRCVSRSIEHAGFPPSRE
jgi:hypothetical protein